MSAAACEVWIWGARNKAAVGAVENLVMSKEVDPTRNKDSQEWLTEINEIIFKATTLIEDKLANLPPTT